MENEIKADLDLLHGDPVIDRTYWTENALAKELGWSRRTLRRLHAQRVGPPRIQLGRKILYSKTSVIAWLASLEETPLRSGRTLKTRKVA